MVLKEEPCIIRHFGNDIRLIAQDIDGHGNYEIELFEFGEVIRSEIGKISDVAFAGELAYMRAEMLNKDGPGQ